MRVKTYKLRTYKLRAECIYDVGFLLQAIEQAARAYNAPVAPILRLVGV